jgi:hypothetical protein
MASTPTLPTKGVNHARPYWTSHTAIRCPRRFLRGGPGAAARCAKLFAWEGGAGFGRNGAAALWIGASKTKPTGIHIALTGANHATVDAFYRAALGASAADNGKPGLRKDYHANYYAAYVIDPDGNNLEAVCHVAA